jgi:hypothetical protein
MGDLDLAIKLGRGCSLWLAEIGEPHTNDLRVVAIEVSASTQPEEAIVGPAFAVLPNQNSRVFELIWNGYAGYSVRNESFFRSEDEDQSNGPLFRRRDTAFPRYLAATTFATDEYPGTMDHWSLYTDGHCVDVVSVDPPEIRELPDDEARDWIARLSAQG